MTENAPLTTIGPPALGSASTMLSWNGTCPESPDGTRLTYVRMERPASAEGETIEADVWVCNQDLTNHRKLIDLKMTCSGFPHNGAMAGWIDDGRLVLRSTEGSAETIFVIDTETGNLLQAPIVGSLGHYPAHPMIFFGIEPGEIEGDLRLRAETNLFIIRDNGDLIRPCVVAPRSITQKHR